MVTDPIGDFIIQLKNSARAGRDVVVVPYSRLKHNIAEVLVREGYIITAVKKGKKHKKFLEVTLVRDKEKGKFLIRDVKRISKPGRRVYVGVDDVRRCVHEQGILILSTPQGVFTGADALKAGVGGEFLFRMW